MGKDQRAQWAAPPEGVLPPVVYVKPPHQRILALLIIVPPLVFRQGGGDWRRGPRTCVQVLIVFIQLKLVFCVSQDLGHRAPLMGGPMTVLYQFLKKW